MLAPLVPSAVAVAETREELVHAELYPVEQQAVARAVEKRRREFVTGRACARLALERLGVPAGPIPPGPRGEPLWPAGIVGSITHCAGYRAAAVARTTALAALGIDAEPDGPLPPGVVEEVVRGRERALLAGWDGPVDLPRLLFCAKEAIYKAWYPLAERWLGFEDVEVSLGPGTGRFRAQLLVDGPHVGDAPLTAFSGRWAARDGIVVASVAVPWPSGQGTR
jgi:4'-phosphopantetheinyl transferase EntD